ncbi:MAG TPA: urate oxidase [Streptosporangiaceae bacterium]
MIVLGRNQFGKAEVRLLRVDRTEPGHVLHDLSVTVTLSGAFEAVHLTGDNDAVLSTDAQKNTVFAFAAEHGVGQIEDFARLLAEHFVTSQEPVTRARVSVEEYAWEPVAGTGHSFARSGRETRTATVTHDGARAWTISGLSDLVLLNTKGSEFWGFARDRYTTLPETKDRILATAVNANWGHAEPARNWDESYNDARDLLISAFAQTHSYSLQQTLYTMGKRVLEGLPGIAEIRLSLPNKHHFDVDMSPFGVDSKGEVFYAQDRPYGLIEGTVRRDDVPPSTAAGLAGAW